MIIMQSLHSADKAPKPTSSIRDFGIRGHTFPIHERSLLEVIRARMKEAEKSGKLNDLQQGFVAKVKGGVESPRAVSTIGITKEPRKVVFDPTLTLTSDLKDNKGRVFARKGTSVNPLDYVSWGSPLLLIDGDDKAQVRLAKKSTDTIVLVKGKPFVLEKSLERPIYFDQGGIIVAKFGVRSVPTRIFQEEKHLVVHAFVVNAKESSS